jgi:hypothetical protein
MNLRSGGSVNTTGPGVEDLDLVGGGVCSVMTKMLGIGSQQSTS